MTYKRLFFSIQNKSGKTYIVTFFSYIKADEIFKDFDNPLILGYCNKGRFSELESAMNSINISYKKRPHKNFKQVYEIDRILTKSELHQLREYFLNNGVALLPTNATINDRIAEYGDRQNLNMLSKFLAFVTPVETYDLDFQTFHYEYAEGTTYVNQPYEKKETSIDITPSIFELKMMAFDKVEKEDFKQKLSKQIRAIAKQTKDIPIVLAVLAHDQKSLTFFNTDRRTGEILFDNTTQLTSDSIYQEGEYTYHDRTKKDGLERKLKRYRFDGKDKVSKEQRELFTKIYKEITERRSS